MIDLHAHIIPGLDDGPAEMAESLEICRAAVRDGIHAMVATPHMFDGVYNVEREDVLRGVEELRRHLAAADIPLTIFPGAETHITLDLPDLIRRGEALTIGDGGKYLLLELPNDIIPPKLDEFLAALDGMGIRVIIAHADRNAEIQKHPDCLREMIKDRHLVQLTAASITGEIGEGPCRCSLDLIESGMCHVVASDCHPDIRPPLLSRAREEVESLVGREVAERIFEHNPGEIVAGREIWSIVSGFFMKKTKRRWRM